jgi:hypothetical protein
MGFNNWLAPILMGAGAVNLQALNGSFNARYFIHNTQPYCLLISKV